jgi:hypothetical protein
MDLINQNLARAHTSARLGEAQQSRLGRELVRGRRTSRRAQQAALQARLTLAS